MMIQTASQAVIEARKFILELLLDEHSADCDKCPAREDCALKKLADDLGVDMVGKDAETSREVDGKIVRIRERCILCAKCVRVCAEIQEAYAIAFRGRGVTSTIGPPRGVSLREAGCVLCRECVEVCPAGAIEFAGNKPEK
jgi:NADH dehydrogenase/NADH:ubiquinone oxidoreductase subunit G